MTALEDVDYAVFLRGVNVAGTTMKMADVKHALAALPVSAVQTLLASGNVVLRTSMVAADVKSQVEVRLRATFGYDAWVVVVDRERLGQLLDACPYPADDAAVHSYVTLFSSEEAQQSWVAEATAGGADAVALGPEAVAWQAPVGETLGSPAGRLTMGREYKAVCTTRNLRTLQKVREAFSQMS
ncbi:DUF1697 domain-containing protein [Arthrobacter sp. Br18]|uniref:DUF1697 domain-containing protein n=1 Tax=Arthrobacter sp. Br18 TaxID=1312954 RepID=UPI00047B1DCB|nr:DUF1697 domain-containing protein [Arthrobacter sp. Br18]